MNINITNNPNATAILARHAKSKRIKFLQEELDNAFYATVRTPQEVFAVYKKLLEFKQLTGKDYKITLKENTIV